MNYLLIPDKFKDSLTAFEVIKSISNGIQKVDQEAKIHSVLASDGLKTFLNASYINGIEFLLQLAKVPELLENHSIDYIITGEGKIDSQTIHGKLVKGVLHLGQKFNIL